MSTQFQKKILFLALILIASSSCSPYERKRSPVQNSMYMNQQSNRSTPSQNPQGNIQPTSCNAAASNQFSNQPDFVDALSQPELKEIPDSTTGRPVRIYSEAEPAKKHTATAAALPTSVDLPPEDRRSQGEATARPTTAPSPADVQRQRIRAERKAQASTSKATNIKSKPSYGAVQSEDLMNKTTLKTKSATTTTTTTTTATPATTSAQADFVPLSNTPSKTYTPADQKQMLSTKQAMQKKVADKARSLDANKAQLQAKTVTNQPANATQQSTAQQTPVLPTATKPQQAIVQPIPVQPAPTQPAPIQLAPAQPAPVQPIPVQPAPTQPAPVQPIPVQPAPAPQAPIQPAPAQLAPVQPIPVQPAPAPQAPSVPEAVNANGPAYDSVENLKASEPSQPTPESARMQPVAPPIQSDPSTYTTPSRTQSAVPDLNSTLPPTSNAIVTSSNTEAYDSSNKPMPSVIADAQ